MRLPDFFVVGAAKSGTTALWEYFQKHSDIFVTDDIAAKELGYFSNQYGVTDKDRYLSYFVNAEPNQIVGEVCHAYLTSVESAAWIKNEVPHAKIIILLRNPVDRAYSLYNWMVMHGYEYESTFEKALDREKELNQNENLEKKLSHTFLLNYHYFETGLYYEQVKRYFDVFGKDQVLVLEYNDFQNNQKQHLDFIYDFLGVSKDKAFKKSTTNKSKRVRSVCFQYRSKKLLTLKFSRFYRVNKLMQKIVIKLAHFVLKYNVVESPPKKLNMQTRERLLNNYKEDIVKLSELCEIDFKNKWI